MWEGSLGTYITKPDLEEGEVTKLRPSLAVGALASDWIATAHCKGFASPLA